MIRTKHGEPVTDKLKKGTQILYVPSHLLEDIEPGQDFYKRVMNKNMWGYPSGIQPGFVTSGPTADDSYFCRYWRWDTNNNEYVTELRTKSNSEKTPTHSIILYSYWNVNVVQGMLHEIESGNL